MLKTQIIVALLLAMLFILSACAAPSAPAPAPEVIEVTAAQLYEEYEANEIAADQKYKDKMLKVTGVVSSIGKDVLGSPYVVLTGGGEYEVWGVQCTFSSAYEQQLAKLTKGQQLAVTGKCKGYLINVLLEVK